MNGGDRQGLRRKRSSSENASAAAGPWTRNFSFAPIVGRGFSHGVSRKGEPVLDANARSAAEEDPASSFTPGRSHPITSKPMEPQGQSPPKASSPGSRPCGATSPVMRRGRPVTRLRIRCGRDETYGSTLIRPSASAAPSSGRPTGGCFCTCQSSGP